ncbi:HAD-IA family hydrolase [Rossellomorea marisflavi]|uniref:HAD-IA family hydrolase n=1 Tax=Rossellomorea marisflavi TaxID=189381 RepID=UPI00345DAC1A
MYQHIMWDFDGTLFDTYPIMADSFRVTLEKNGISEPLEEIMGLMRISMSTAIHHYQELHRFDEAFLSDYHEERKSRELDAKPFEGIARLCGQIHKTGRHNYLYTHRGESAVTMLKTFGLVEFFTDFITEEHGFERKPSPDAILHLLSKHAIAPEKAIMIGDRDLDIMAGKNAGIDACLYTDKPISDSQADYIIHDIQELRPILDIRY